MCLNALTPEMANTLFLVFLALLALIGIGLALDNDIELH